MAKPAALPVVRRKPGNPNWGKPMPYVKAFPTEFEIQAKHLRLTAEKYVFSPELRRWCQQNRNRCYIPEWLLEEWHLSVDPTFTLRA